MRTITCPKCNEVVIVPDNQNYVICCNEVIYAPDETDANIFFNELTNPSKPNEALKNAAARYKKRINETHDSKDETTSGVSQ